MEKNGNIESLIIRDIVLEDYAFDPLSDQFDIKLFEERIRSRITELLPEGLQFSTDELLKFVPLFKEFNEMQTELLKGVESAIHKMGLPNVELIELVLTLTNSNFFNLTDHTFASLKNTSRFHFGSGLTVKDALGDEIDATSAMDVSNDSAEVAIKFIQRYNIHHKAVKAKESSTRPFGACHRLIILSNIWYILDDLINSFKYEFFTISITEDIVQFSPFPQNYPLLTKAGNERYRNNVMEYFFRFGDKTARKTVKPAFLINNSVLSMAPTREQLPNLMFATSQGAMLIYFFHLNLIKLPGLNDLTINDIYTIISEIQFAFSQIKIVDESNNTEHIGSGVIPVKVKKNDLISFVENSTKLNKRQIVSCVQELASHITLDVNLWKTPLIAFSDYYYFTLPSLVGSHIVCLMQKVVDKALSKEQQLSYFRSFVEQDIKFNTTVYEFKRIPWEDVKVFVPDASPQILIYKMGSNIVLVNSFLYDFPLNSMEYNLALEAAADAELQLIDYINVLTPFLKEFVGTEEAKIISIVLTNYPLVSGIRVGKSHVMDLNLLTNYLSKGEYEQGRVVFEHGKISVNGSLRYPYYNTEQEFNDRFKMFCNSPDLINEIIYKYVFKDTELLKDMLSYKLIVQGVSEDSDVNIAFQFIKRLEFCVKQFFYFEKALSKEEHRSNRDFIESRFRFLMPQCFAIVANENRDRFLRIELIRVFEEAGMIGVGNLIFLEDALVNRVKKKTIKDKIDHLSIRTDHLQIESDIMNLILKLKEGGYSSLGEKEIKMDLPKDQVDRIVDALVIMLDKFEVRYCSPEELEEQWFFTFILSVATAGNKVYEDYVSSSFLNFIDILNHNFLYQKARDLAEEILEFSFKNHETPIIGWLCLFKCYTKQGNVREALVYANLVLSILDLYSEIEFYLFFDCFFQIMLLHREIGDLQAQTKVFNQLRALALSEYEEQKIHLSHYNAFLLRGHEFSEVYEQVKTFLTERLSKILSFGQDGALPWAAFILNVHNLIKSNFIPNDIFWEEALTKFKEVIDPTTYNNLYSQFHGDSKNGKELFKEILLRIFETRSYGDLANEIQNVKLLANEMAVNAITQGDFEILFLFGFVSNDQSLIFKQVQAPDKTSLLAVESSAYLDRVNNYLSFINNSLHLKVGQKLVWVFSIHSEVFCVFISSKESYQAKRLIQWDVIKMDKWIAELTDFYFPDKGEYSINDQEDKYLRVLDALSIFQIPFDEEFDELLIYTDIKTGMFPFNLITFNPGGSSLTLELHEYKVQTAVSKGKLDFISYHKPVTNVVSLEWFIDNSAELQFQGDQFTVEAWSPIDDNDMVLQITCEKLRPLLKSKYNCEIVTERVPSKPLSSVINIFLAHGGKDLEGFKTIYTRESEGYAIIKDQGIKKIIGTGNIAIVFVCNSAYISKQLFSERLISFTQHVLSLGYQAVVAPAWSLNPDIVTPWTEIFLDAMKAGKTVSFAVHSSNTKISKEGYSEYNGFYDPAGWASMHLYGNPNVSFIEMQNKSKL